MTVLQDNNVNCRELPRSSDTQNQKNFSLPPPNERNGHIRSDVKVQDQPQARQSLLENIRGAPSAPTSSGKTPFLVILTADQARMIYSLRSESTAQSFELRSVAGKSSLVAELYGVSPKTIRDVWNRKTWTQVHILNVVLYVYLPDY
jgi:hypothetical protein